MRQEWATLFGNLPPELHRNHRDMQEVCKRAPQGTVDKPRKQFMKVRFESDGLGSMNLNTRKSDGNQSLSAFDEDKGGVEIDVTIDSGACDTVMPIRLCPHSSILQTEESRKGLEYEVTNGETIPNAGERHLLLLTEDSQQMKTITFQCADIHKPLLSVSRCADLGYLCILGKEGGELVDEITGETIPLHRRGTLYVMRVGPPR